MLAGNLAVVNSIGTAVADDKVIHGYTDSIISYYLDEDPILAAVPSYDLGDEKHLARAEDRVVNSSQGGGAKATFVTTETPKRMESP